MLVCHRHVAHIRPDEWVCFVHVVPVLTCTFTHTQAHTCTKFKDEEHTRLQTPVSHTLRSLCHTRYRLLCHTRFRLLCHTRLSLLCHAPVRIRASTVEHTQMMEHTQMIRMMEIYLLSKYIVCTNFEDEELINGNTPRTRAHTHEDTSTGNR
jgi:hypothetical protein